MYEQIYTTYHERFHELDHEHQFHFASRLALTADDAWARAKIDELESAMLGSSADSSLRLLRGKEPTLTDVNAAALRMPLFKQSPWLYDYELMLFYALHAKVQYDMDVTEQLKTQVQVSLDQLHSLVTDPRTLATLSTYLVNAYYLHARLIDKTDQVIPLEAIQEALDTPLDDPNDARLKLYLLTHCVLAETLFYARTIPASLQSYYHEIAEMIAARLESSWNDLTLDAKLEAAYCLKILSVRTDLQANVIQDAQAHYSDAHGYIIDPRSQAKNSLNGAEHRNVLFLMLTHRAS
ncbi:MAG TPA: hypothetical protein VL362_03120 [Patescibacteria group bacterium]|jgi:hypothetical protein|nr:hypothetical protein [Patescibacteria group bacterium]